MNGSPALPAPAVLPGSTRAWIGTLGGMLGAAPAQAVLPLPDPK